MARIRTRTGGRVRASGNKSGFTVEGAELIDRILSALPPALGSRAIRQALNSAAKPLIKQARANAPVDDGDLRRSIGAISGRNKHKQQQIYVGPRRGSGRYSKGYHGHLVEYGAAPRRIREVKKGNEALLGKELGTMPAKPFLRPAWEQTNAQVRAEMVRNLREILDSNFKNVKF